MIDNNRGERSDDEGDQKPDDPSTTDLLEALRHPLRRRILQEMPTDGSMISPKELAHLLRAPLTNVGYHVRVLARCGAIKLVAGKPVRGSMQHFYTVEIEAIEVDWVREVLELDSDDENSRST